MSFVDEEYKQKLIQRMEERLAKGQSPDIFQLGGQRYTPQERIDEAKRGTPAGEEILYAEKKLMDELKKRR